MNSARSILLSLLLLAAAGARADWRFDVETGWFYDSNLSNSDRAAEEEDDWSWQTRAHAANGFQLSRDLRLTLAADVGSAVWGQYSGFNQVNGGASVLLRCRFGLGRAAPWISAENRIGYSAFEEDFRNGWDEAVHLRGGFAFNDRIRVEGGYTYENSCTREQDVWSWCAQRGDLSLIVDLSSSLQLALGYSYRDGDIVSYAVPPRPDIVSVAKNIATGNMTFDQLRNAYRIGARTHAASLSASYAVNRYLAVQVGYEYRHSSHDPLEYENHLVTAKLAFGY